MKKMMKPNMFDDNVTEELADALNGLDNMSTHSNGEEEPNWEEEDSENEDDGDKPPEVTSTESNLLSAKALERAGLAEDEYARMQLKDYQQRLFKRTTLLEEMRKSYLRDVVVLKNLMKVNTIIFNFLGKLS